MKKGHYYLNQIPLEALEEFKELTGKNHEEMGLNWYLNQEFNSFTHFLLSSFQWSKSKLGADYWLYLKPIEIPIIPEQRNEIPLPCRVSC